VFAAKKSHLFVSSDQYVDKVELYFTHQQVQVLEELDVAWVCFLGSLFMCVISRCKGSFSGEGEADEEDSQQTQLHHISGYSVIQEVTANTHIHKLLG